MTEGKKKQYIADVRVKNYLLQAIPNDIYNSRDVCKNAKEMWERIKSKRRGILDSVHERLTTLVNIMDRNNVRPKPVAINTKFLNCLQPEWSKYVTMVRHNQTGAPVSYDVLYDSLVQFVPHVLASRAKKAAKNHDPLALIAHSNASSSHSHANSSYSPQPYYVTHPPSVSVVDYDDEYQRELQGNSQEDKLTTAMMLLARAISLKVSTPTNNRLRISSNTRNQAVVQDGWVDIQTKNAGYGRNANKNAGRNRTQGFNTGNAENKAFKEREERYLDDILYLEEKLSSHDRIVYKIGQSIQTIHMLGKKLNKVYDPFLKAGLGYTNFVCLKKAIATQPKMYDGDLIHNNKLVIHTIDSEETLEDAEESRNKMRHNMVQIDYEKLNALNETFVPQQELYAEQTYFSIPYTSDNGSTSKDVLSESPEQQKHELLKVELKKISSDSIDIQANLLKRIKILENNFQRSQAQSIAFELKLQHQKEKMDCDVSWKAKLSTLHDENVLLKHQVESTVKERENIKLEFQRLFNSIKATRAQHQNEINEMFEDVTQKTYAYADVRAQNQDLLMTISELKSKLKTIDKGKHVNTKFDKSETLGQLLCVTPFNKNLAIKAKNVSNTKVTSDRSNPVTSQSTPTIEKKQQHNANVIARGMYKINQEDTKTPDSKANTNVSNSTGVGSSNSVRRPKSKDNKSKNNVLKNTKSSSTYVLKTTNSVCLDSNKCETKPSNVCQTNACRTSSKTINAVNDGLNMLCISCGLDVFLHSHEKCVARNALTRKSSVKRALFTSPVTAKSKGLGATSVVAKSRFSVAKTPTTTNKVSSVSPLSQKSSQSRILSSYMNNKIATSRKWQKWFEYQQGFNWTPKSKTAQSQSRETKSSTHVIQLVLWIVDSGCLRHMTGNLQLLRNFIEKFMGTVRFGNDHFAAITCYGDYVQGNLTICHVYYVKGLRHNLFSVGQFCDGDLEGKSKKASLLPKLVPSTKSKLELLHMDLCGPMRVASINGKKYILVIIDDYSRKPNVQYFHVFGSLCYPTNDRDDLGKMKPKADVGIFVGYSESSHGFRIYNRQNKKIMKTIHVKFDELTAMAFECNNLEPGMNCMNFNDSSEDSQSVPSTSDLDNLFGPMHEEYYPTSSHEVFDNSAANTLDNDHTSSSSSIVVDHDDAP
ncbi:retrovirus-related pol polyprotein from transposon TNT 1-94 [Tanacetum coccineum]